MTDFILVKDIPVWEVAHLNPKMAIGGSLYRCPKCSNELFVPYGRSIQCYKYCDNCKARLRSEVN
jgi:hypothetical protein